MSHYACRLVPVCAFAFLVGSDCYAQFLLGNSNQLVYGEPGRYEDFTVDISINGTDFELLVEDQARISVRAETSLDRTTAMDVRVGGNGRRWYLLDQVNEFSFNVDGHDVDIRLSSINRVSITSRRLQTQIWVDGIFEYSNYFMRHLFPQAEFNIPLIVNSPIVRTGPLEYTIESVLGPRYLFDDPLVLFDQNVGGDPFRITASGMGFTDIGRQTLVPIPEPSSIALVTICAVDGTGIFWRRNLKRECCKLARIEHPCLANIRRRCSWRRGVFAAKKIATRHAV